MLQYSYHREIYKQLIQFSAAFDDSFVYRFTKEGEPKEKINVRYVFGPKQRVMYDIVNQAKNITLPVISIEQTNVRRDPTRIQNKDHFMTRLNHSRKSVSKIPAPIPVIIDLKVSIITGYKEDIDQIACNIIPFCNPYFIIAWKVPEEFGMDFIDEIRSEVSWSGSIDFENPVNITNTDKYVISGTTAFTLKGWIFPPHEVTQAPIYVVNTNFIAVSSNLDIFHYNYNTNHSGYDFSDVTETILISAYPEFTNAFYKGIPIFENIAVSENIDHMFTFYGKRYSYNNAWYLSGSNITNLQLEEIDTAKFPTISAFRIPDNWITTVNDNIAAISFSSGFINPGTYTFVTANSAGWGVWENTVTVFSTNDDTNNLFYNGATLIFNGNSMTYNGA